MITICKALKLTSFLSFYRTKSPCWIKLSSSFCRVNRGVEPEAEMAPRNEDMVEVKLILSNHLECFYGCKTLPFKSVHLK